MHCRCSCVANDCSSSLRLRVERTADGHAAHTARCCYMWRSIHVEDTGGRWHLPLSTSSQQKPVTIPISSTSSPSLHHYLLHHYSNHRHRHTHYSHIFVNTSQPPLSQLPPSPPSPPPLLPSLLLGLYCHSFHHYYPRLHHHHHCWSYHYPN